MRSLMYGALLGMVFFLPYSFALIETCQITMIAAWAVRCYLSCRTPAGLDDRFPRSSFFSHSISWPLVAIALLIVLTMPFSHDPALTLKKFCSRFLQQVFLMYLFTEIVYSRKRLYGVLSVMLITLFFVTIDIMVQCTLGKSFVHHTHLIFGRVTGPMNHPNDLGTF